MTPFDALVEHARTVATAHEWKYELNQLERRLIASTAANLHGTSPVEPSTKVIQAVYAELQKQEASVT